MKKIGKKILAGMVGATMLVCIMAPMASAASCTNWENIGGAYGGYCDYNSGICNPLDWSHSHFAFQEQQKNCIDSQGHTTYLYQTIEVKDGCC